LSFFTYPGDVKEGFVSLHYPVLQDKKIPVRVIFWVLDRICAGTFLMAFTGFTFFYHIVFSPGGSMV